MIHQLQESHFALSLSSKKLQVEASFAMTVGPVVGSISIFTWRRSDAQAILKHSRFDDCEGFGADSARVYTLSQGSFCRQWVLVFLVSRRSGRRDQIIRMLWIISRK